MLMTSLHPHIAKAIPLFAVSLLAGLNGWFGVCEAVELAPAQIQKQVVAHVKEKLQGHISQNDQTTITIDATIPPYAQLSFPQTENASAIKISTESTLGEQYSDRTIVRVHLESPDGTSHDLGVPVHIIVKKPVWVVKTAVTAQRPLRAADFTLQTRDVSYNYRYAIGQETNLNDYVARVNLMPGEVLDNRKIIIPPDVSYNSDVMILLSSNSGMTVSVPGIAMANGRIGETIRVRQSVFQHKYYNARIIDRSRVLVQI
jgi:flagella basal body P-ring formation protein FlgA